MTSPNNKENLAPLTSSDPLNRAQSSSPKKTGRKGRSKSIGPGGLDELSANSVGARKDAKDAKNRRKSAFIPTVKSILPSREDEAKRKADRRKSLANRRVSFAPEATLHTWDVIEYMRDHTTSTDSSDSTRRASNITRHATPQKASPLQSSDDGEPPSTPPEQEDGAHDVLSSPAPQRNLHQKKRRRSSGTSPMDFNNPDDVSSPSGISGSSDVSESEGESEGESESEEGSEDATGTAMSLDVGDSTQQSVDSGSSTSSSARLDAALRQAAHVAGTRGIEYDEHGEMSMELASEEVTNAFKPWVQRNEDEAFGSASHDQENVNPFSPAFKAQLASGIVQRPSTVQEEDEEDMSMDVTRAVGGILYRQNQQQQEEGAADEGDGTMDLTQAVGKVLGKSSQEGQKRRRSTTDAGSPGVDPTRQSKRRRSSLARSSTGGDETMDLTMAVGGIQSTGSPTKPARRKSLAKRHSSGAASDADEATMDLTTAAGGVNQTGRLSDAGFDEGFSMELTTALGGIKESIQDEQEQLPATPLETPTLPMRAVNTTPKDQERFKDAPDSGPKKLLTPIFQKQVQQSGMDHPSNLRRSSRRTSMLSEKATESSEGQRTHTPELSPERGAVSYRKSSQPGSPHTEKPLVQSTPLNGNRATPDSELRQQLHAQLQDVEPSPTALKHQRSSPLRRALTPQQAVSQQATPQRAISKDITPRQITPKNVTPQRLVPLGASPSKEGVSLAENMKLMSTPRKETLKPTTTPKKQTPAKEATPRRTMTPRSKTTRNKLPELSSPARTLSDELQELKSKGEPARTYHLHEFLDEAGIRFMDLTTTKRRMTTAPTPSKAHEAPDLTLDEPVTLESGIVAGACTAPELDMFSHACRELRQYLSEGKAEIKQLEQDTYNETPLLIQTYMSADSDRKAAIDAQLRDIKTHARYLSKQSWYGWRSQLLEDLMKGLQGIGENLIKDDETLQQAEQVLDQTLPPLVKLHEDLQHEAKKLEQVVAATSEEDKADLEDARETLVAVDADLGAKKEILQNLQAQVHEQEQLVDSLQENKDEFTEAIKEADRVREACRGVSLNEISQLKASVKLLEDTYGWTIASASSTPATVTMAYKKNLQLFFHPDAFLQPGSPSPNSGFRPNAPISLFHNTPTHHRSETQEGSVTTTLRFFLQLLRASLLALPQYKTSIPTLLNLVSQGWETALAISESARRLALESLTNIQIKSDEQLGISSLLLLPKVKTKVQISFDVTAALGEADSQVNCEVQTAAKVVYGEAYDEAKLAAFVNERIDGLEGWDGAVREMRDKLVAQGPKGKRV